MDMGLLSNYLYVSTLTIPHTADLQLRRILILSLPPALPRNLCGHFNNRSLFTCGAKDFLTLF